MNTKAVTIVTYCASTSIGSLLQSFALCRALEEIGFSGRVMIPKSYTAPKKKSLKGRVKKFLSPRKVTAGQKLGLQKRESFIRDYIDPIYYDDIIPENNRLPDSAEDLYLAGSDQIWNPVECDPYYFLRFLKHAVKLSYAVSMGTTDIPDHKKPFLRDYLSDFRVISVREKECKEALRGYTDQDISVNIDPTFLLSASEWEKIARKYDINGRYILLYMLYWDPALAKEIKELKDRTGLPVYAITNDISRVFADHFLYDVGTENFIWLIRHAEYVVSSSFHGVAMSIIMNKTVSAIVNPAAPSRILNILRTLSAPLVPISKLDSTNAFDYEKINSAIETERTRSFEFLNQILKV